MRCLPVALSMLLGACIAFWPAVARTQTPPPFLAPWAPESAAQPPPNSLLHPFKTYLRDQIGRILSRDVQASSQKIAPGTIRIALTASSNGKITNLRVLSNTSNQP